MRRRPAAPEGIPEHAEPVAGRNAPRALTLARLRLNTSLASYRLNLAAAQFLLALERRAGFDPDQPRVPAGNPDGGEWTEGSGGRGSNFLVGETPSNSVPILVAADRIFIDQPPEFSVREQEELGGHTIKRHVGRSDASLVTHELAETRPGSVQESEGSFSSEENAEFFINETIRAVWPKVQAFLANKKNKGDFFEHRFNYQTGKEAFTSAPGRRPYIRATTAVRVVLRKNRKAPHGFRVITAFPIHEELMQE